MKRKKVESIINNVIMFDNVWSDELLSPDNIQNALIIKMSYESDGWLINTVWNIFKFLIRRERVIDEAFRTFEK